MPRSVLIAGLALLPLAACGPSYSPDTYSQNAVQQANKAEQGVLIGVRPIKISASGAIGTVTGAAAGGIAGSQAVAGPASAFTALGGSLVGGLAGSAVEHATADSDGFEYIVKKTDGSLVSVTQKDTTPLTLGQKVLVIAGNQARVVPDYTVPQDAAAPRPAAPARLVVPPTPDTATPAIDPRSTDPRSTDPRATDTRATDTPPAEAPKPPEPGALQL